MLSNNDGFVVARSKEAKALGIPDLDPFFKIEHATARRGGLLQQLPPLRGYLGAGDGYVTGLQPPD